MMVTKFTGIVRLVIRIQSKETMNQMSVRKIRFVPSYHEHVRAGGGPSLYFLLAERTRTSLDTMWVTVDHGLPNIVERKLLVAWLELPSSPRARTSRKLPRSQILLVLEYWLVLRHL